MGTRTPNSCVQNRCDPSFTISPFESGGTLSTQEPLGSTTRLTPDALATLKPPTGIEPVSPAYKAGAMASFSYGGE